MAGFGQRHGSDRGDVAHVDEAGARRADRHKDLVAIPDFGAVRGVQVLHEEAAAQEGPRLPARPQICLDLVVRHELSAFDADQRKKRHLFYAGRFCRIQRGDHVALDVSDLRWTHQEHLFHAVKRLVIGFLAGEVENG